MLLPSLFACDTPAAHHRLNTVFTSQSLRLIEYYVKLKDLPNLRIYADSICKAMPKGNDHVRFVLTACEKVIGFYKKPVPGKTGVFTFDDEALKWAQEGLEHAQAWQDEHKAEVQVSVPSHDTTLALT